MIVTLSSPGFNSITVDLVPVVLYVPPAPPTPAPPPAPGPTPPAPATPAPPVSLIPRLSMPGSEVFSSPRNDYVSGTVQPSLPLRIGNGITGQYNGLFGRTAGSVFQNVPFIVPAGFTDNIWIDWSAASHETPAPVWVAVSRTPDDWQGTNGVSLTGLGPRSATANGNAPFAPTGFGLFYVVLKLQTPGSGDKLVRIAA